MFTKQQFIDFRKDFAETVKTLEEKYSIKIDLGKISYTDSSFTSSIEVFDVKNGKTPEQIDFENRCYKFGLYEEDFGKEVKIDNQTLKIAGINGNKRKFPIVLEKMDGSKVAGTAEGVRKALGYQI